MISTSWPVTLLTFLCICGVCMCVEVCAAVCRFTLAWVYADQRSTPSVFLNKSTTLFLETESLSEFRLASQQAPAVHCDLPVSVHFLPWVLYGAEDPNLGAKVVAVKSMH